MMLKENESIIGYIELWILQYSPISAVGTVAHIQSYYVPDLKILNQILNYVTDFLRSHVTFILTRPDISQNDLHIFKNNGFVEILERRVHYISKNSDVAPLSRLPSGITIQEAEKEDLLQVLPLWIAQAAFHSLFHEIHAIKVDAGEIWYSNAQEKQHTPTYRCFVAKNHQKEVIAYVEAHIRPHPSWHVIPFYGLVGSIRILPAYRRPRDCSPSRQDGTTEFFCSPFAFYADDN
ncbi:MAG: hypothetical protein ACFFBD_14995 [Candidatus Hodarchaeota archaeon]